MAVPHALGIDVGSTTTKIVGVDGDGNLVWYVLEPTEARIEEQIDRLLASVPDGGTAQSVSPRSLVATGYGRRLVRQADRSVTEITCHARGVYPRCTHRAWRD